MGEQVSVDARKLEVVKVWYAIFCGIMDNAPQFSDQENIGKLQQLRARLKQEAPELEPS